MAQYEHLPIYKQALDLAVYLEKAVSGFSRYYKYRLGADLRRLARQNITLIVQANSEQERLATLFVERIKFRLFGSNYTRNRKLSGACEAPFTSS